MENPLATELHLTPTGRRIPRLTRPSVMTTTESFSPDYATALSVYRLSATIATTCTIDTARMHGAATDAAVQRTKESVLRGVYGWITPELDHIQLALSAGDIEQAQEHCAVLIACLEGRR